jgi:hypothetical protein
MQHNFQVKVTGYKGSTLGTVYHKIPRGDMKDQNNKCDPQILFKITKKEADFVFKLPRSLQEEFEKYLRMKQKLARLIMTFSMSKYPF